jgi:hypothetical protein
VVAVRVPDQVADQQRLVHHQAMHGFLPREALKLLCVNCAGQAHSAFP